MPTLLPVPASGGSPSMPSSIGRYRILCELGTGSMATLYLARTSGVGRFERLFAVKVTHDHLCKDRAFVEMFMNEARIAAKIQHPNVIPVYEIDVEAGRYYMVMDYVSGETLALALKNTWNKDRPFPPAFAAQIVASACEGLHAAHELTGPEGELGVVHRDVAPQNLMVGYDGIVRVMDFGIAKARDTISTTKPGVMKGTIAYMAPEQVRCQPVDRRVDVFALGTILWESTVGMRLFRHKNDVTTAARVVKMQVPPPSTLRSGYPLELERIVMKALQRDPEQRYQTARAMGEELAEYLHASGERVTPAVLGAFMQEIFPDRLPQRREMETRAREEEPPPDLVLLSGEVSGASLGVVNEHEEVDLEDLDGPISFYESAGAGSKPGEKSEAAPPSDAPASTSGGAESEPRSTPEAGPPSDTSASTSSADPSKGDPADEASSGATAVNPGLQREIPTMLVRDRTPSQAPLGEVVPETREISGELPEEPKTKQISVDLGRTETSAEEPEQTKELAAGASRRTPLYVGVAVVVCALLLALALGRDTAPKTEEGEAATPMAQVDEPPPIAAPPNEPPPPPAETPAGSVEEKAEPPPPAVAEKVTVRFDVTPPDAELSVNGDPVTGPLEIPKSDESLVVRATAQGYRPRTVIVAAESDQVVQVTLDRLPDKKPQRRRKWRKRVRKNRRERKPQKKVEKKSRLLFGSDDI